MVEQGRQESGKFAAKSEEIRQVRAIRLTDTTWDKLGEWAELQSLSRADFLEELVKKNVLQKEVSLKQESNNEDAIFLSKESLEKIDRIASLWRITRLELLERLINSETFNQKTKPVDTESIKGNELAQRLGVDPKTIRDYRDGKRGIGLVEWSRTKTVDGKGWDYSPETKLYFQVD